MVACWQQKQHLSWVTMVLPAPASNIGPHNPQLFTGGQPPSKVRFPKDKRIQTLFAPAATKVLSSSTRMEKSRSSDGPPTGYVRLSDTSTVLEPRLVSSISWTSSDGCWAGAYHRSTLRKESETALTCACKGSEGNEGAANIQYYIQHRHSPLPHAATKKEQRA